MNTTILILFVLGFAGLMLGGELLVRGAARLAAAAGIPPLIVGLTVVAFGTSSPEIAVMALACVRRAIGTDHRQCRGKQYR